MKKLRVPLLFAALLLACALWFGLEIRDVSAQESNAVRQAVLDAAVQCCAIEGAYPPNVAYLEAHYGLVIDHGRYIVDYELYASNILPEVEILRK